VAGAAQPPVGLVFLRCEGASPPAAILSTKIHVAHHRIKIERVYCPYLTATEAGGGSVTMIAIHIVHSTNPYHTQNTTCNAEWSMMFSRMTVTRVFNGGTLLLALYEPSGWHNPLLLCDDIHTYKLYQLLPKCTESIPDLKGFSNHCRNQG
jgi:hypothetical protein